MKIAFLKSKKHIFNRVVSCWTRGPYSHCEVVFSDGMCASSSFLDHGVRFKRIDITSEDYDVLDVPNIDEAKVRQWFVDHLGQKYDVIGLLSPLTPIHETKYKWFCNESIGAAMGIPEPWRFTPNSFACVCEAMGGKWIE